MEKAIHEIYETHEMGEVEEEFVVCFASFVVRCGNGHSQS